MDKQALIDAVKAAVHEKRRGEHPPHKLLLKYPRLYSGGVINADGIATVRLIEAMRKDPALLAFDGGFMLVHGGAVRIDLVPIAKWLWTQFKQYRDAAAAVDRLENLLRINKITARTVMALTGIELKANVELAENVRLMPFDDLPPSETKKVFLGERQFAIGGPPWRPSAALICTHDLELVLLSREVKDRDRNEIVKTTSEKKRAVRESLH